MLGAQVVPPTAAAQSNPALRVSAIAVHLIDYPTKQ